MIDPDLAEIVSSDVSLVEAVDGLVRRKTAERLDDLAELIFVHGYAERGHALGWSNPSRKPRLSKGTVRQYCSQALGARWWRDFDARTCEAISVETAADPLHHYVGQMRQELRAEALDRLPHVRAEILRLAVLDFASAIAGGALVLNGLRRSGDTVVRCRIDADFLGSGGRDWSFQADGGELHCGRPRALEFWDVRVAPSETLKKRMRANDPELRRATEEEIRSALQRAFDDRKAAGEKVPNGHEAADLAKNLLRDKGLWAPTDNIRKVASQPPFRDMKLPIGRPPR